MASQLKEVMHGIHYYNNYIIIIRQIKCQIKSETPIS